jgi:hypothetical protein
MSDEVYQLLLLADYLTTPVMDLLIYIVLAGDKLLSVDGFVVLACIV